MDARLPKLKTDMGELRGNVARQGVGTQFRELAQDIGFPYQRCSTGPNSFACVQAVPAATTYAHRSGVVPALKLGRAKRPMVPLPSASA